MFVGFVLCFTFGGFTGLILANQSIDLAYHDTYFVVGHFHFVLSIAAAVTAFLFLINFLSAVNSSGSNHFAITFIVLLGFSAVNLLFLVQHVIGIEGHPRRVFLSPEIFVGLANFANISVPMLILTLQLFAIRKSAAIHYTEPKSMGEIVTLGTNTSRQSSSEYDFVTRSHAPSTR